LAPPSSSDSRLDPPLRPCPDGAAGWTPVFLAALLQRAAAAAIQPHAPAGRSEEGGGGGPGSEASSPALADRLVAAQCACLRLAILAEGPPADGAAGGPVGGSAALHEQLALPAARTPGLLGHYRRRLLRTLLDPSLRYDAPAALQLLPASAAAAPGELREERAEVLRRLGRHGDALRILVLELRDEAAAQRYCEAAIASSAAGGGDAGTRRREVSRVFTALLHAHLSPPPSSQQGQAAQVAGRPLTARRVARIEDAAAAHGSATSSSPPQPLQPSANGDAAPASSACADRDGRDRDATLARLMPFLLRHFGHLDVSRALRELPPDVSLASVLPLLSSALHHEAAVSRACRAASQLELIARVQAAHRLQGRQEALRFAVARETACHGCGRLLAPGGDLSPVVCHPSGHVYHAHCSPRAEPEDEAAASTAASGAGRGGGGLPAGSRGGGGSGGGGRAK